MSEVSRDQGRWLAGGRRWLPAGRRTGRPPLDRTGFRYGRLVVLRHAGRSSKGFHTWLCKCDCGVEKEIIGNQLSNGCTNSCGCLAVEVTVARSVTHGCSQTPTFKTWVSMRRRCRPVGTARTKRYGDRGIWVDPRWERFENFLEDMGERPPGTSIDRIDPNGPYAPWNCRWATPKVQRANQVPRPLRFCEEDGCDRPHYGKGMCSMHYQREHYTPRPSPIVTKCPNEHPYTTANSIVSKDGYRACRICGAVRSSARYKANKAGVRYVDPFLDPNFVVPSKLLVRYLPPIQE